MHITGGFNWEDRVREKENDRRRDALNRALTQGSFAFPPERVRIDFTIDEHKKERYMDDKQVILTLLDDDNNLAGSVRIICVDLGDGEYQLNFDTNDEFEIMYGSMPDSQYLILRKVD